MEADLWIIPRLTYGSYRARRYISVVDVEATLRRVCKKVLTDTSVAKEARGRRATALRRLGEIFGETLSPDSTSGDGKTKTLRERLEEFAGMFGPPPGADGEGEEGAGGEEEEESGAEPNVASAEGGGEGGGEGGAASAGGPSPAPTREELQAMSVRQLKALLAEKGLSAEEWGCIEKGDFVDAILGAQGWSAHSHL